ncbi:MAG: hypothetical protein MUO82_10765 [Candidatus Thermoplasmatota archaeon]|nr:hypothetical protein [Candidatus Thermoplasmatota archaeon]
MKGFYYCNKCKLFIETMSFVRTLNLRKSKKEIKFCPHCLGEIIEVDRENYINKDYSLFMRAYRTYNNKKILLSMRFLL